MSARGRYDGDVQSLQPAAPGGIVVGGAAGQAVDSRLGLIPPPGGVWRYLAQPAVMSSPPTVTPGAANAASAITNSVHLGPFNGADGVHWPDARFTLLGVQVGFGASYPNTVALSPDNISTPTGGTAIYADGPWGVEFEFDGQKLELGLIGHGARYRLRVDGNYDQQFGRSDYTADGNFYNVLYDFGSRANRRLRWDFSPNMFWTGFYVGPNDTVWGTSQPTTPKLAILGDSFTQGTGASAAFANFGAYLGDLLGWRNIVASGIGGTGYLNPGSGVPFSTRLQADIVAAAPDIIVVAGGINDQGSYGKAQIQNAAASLFAAIKTGLPHAKLIVLGPFWPNGSPVQGVIDTRDAIKAAAGGVADLFIDNIVATVPGANTLGWMTGTGHVGATTGSGNADLYTGSDSTHPTDAGHAYLARRLAAAISAAMPL